MTTNRDDGNLYSGGHSLAGFVGLQKERNNLVYGGQTKYQVMFDRSETVKSTSGSSRTDVTVSNGNRIAVEGFVEMPRNQQLYGAKMELAQTLATDYLFKNQNGGKINLDTAAHNTLRIGAYGNFAVKSMSNLEILPEITYGKFLGDSGGSFNVRDSSDETLVNIAARFSL